MRKILWAVLLGLPLVVAGAVAFAGGTAASTQQVDEPFVCPLTGEELPCPKCCPLNDE